MSQTTPKKKVIRKRTEEEKEIYKLKKKLNYYKDLDNKGQVIHDYIFEDYISSVKLFYEIMGEMPEDYKFDKTNKKQQRDITKYNYENNYQHRYCGALARKFKQLTGIHPPKFKKYRKTINQEEKEEFIRDQVENIQQEEAMNTGNDNFNIADKNKSTKGSCMYPLEFKNKHGETLFIIDIARQLLKENPPSIWKESLQSKDQKEVITCKCGRGVQRKSMNRHLETDIHKNLMKKKLIK